MPGLIVGKGALSKLGALVGARRAMIVSEPNVWRLFKQRISLKNAALHLLPQGEKAKHWNEAGKLLEAMAETGLGRDGILVALGGGAVTDCAGFAAASYLRGIDWISVPTSLLGQLDSGIGGKTGVNLDAGKNLAGAFHLPAQTICDTSLLESLPQRERVSGLAEALKIGLVFEPGFWRMMTRDWEALVLGRGLEKVVERAAAWKLKVVAADLRETKGRRILLNFGHTLGHALETAAGHGVIRQGEAVIWGMRAAARLSYEHAGLPEDDYWEIESFLSRIEIPRPKVRLKRLLAAARKDKKAKAGALRFVLLRKLGRPCVLALSESKAASTARALL